MASSTNLILALACMAFCRVTEIEGAASPNIISRKGWEAKSPKTSLSALSENPPTYVIIHHSATPGCTTQATCQARVRSIQNHHMDSNKWNDIGYNFLVGEDGNVYEGRGWGKQGSHAVDYNSKSIGICVIGTFVNVTPNQAAIRATKNLIAYGVANDKIKSNYKLLGHRQAAHTDCPGNSLFELIKTWPNWTNTK